MSPLVARVLEALAEAPVIAFYGALGSGRTTVAQAVAEELRELGVAVVVIDAETVHSLAEFNEPVERELGLLAGELAHREIARNVRLRVILDNAHLIYDAPWVNEFQ